MRRELSWMEECPSIILIEILLKKLRGLIKEGSRGKGNGPNVAYS